ncbi:MAG: MiaB/RimO family radical SAM methylthiotransferase [Deltaproteobacteria bacterium]|nr:MiaB/RimO family radical SAM methylthiotransferase [Deltaproteobacteria bacterium]
MKFAITTLGCKVNQYEGQRIKEALRSHGHTEQSFSRPGAHCYIINTCTVTHRSDADARKLIRAALRSDGRVVVTGCQAAVYPQDIRGLSDRIEVVLPEDIARHFGACMPGGITEFKGHSRAFVKVQSGCDNFCSYCVVPFARGKPWSRPWADVVAEINTLAEKGYNEVVLCGINIGLYVGGITSLLHRILAHTSIPRIRISSIEPWTVTDELIDIVVSEPRICRHLHLPLQSGSDRILSSMGRPYDAAYFENLVRNIRKSSADIAIGSDVMVGFPGEDQQCFQETYFLIKSLDITYLHVFPYSARQGTRAAVMAGQVDASVKKERAFMLRNLSLAKKDAFIRSRLGLLEDVVVTHAGPGLFSGITSNYLKIQVPGSACVNDLKRIRLADYTGKTIIGSLGG